MKILKCTGVYLQGLCLAGVLFGGTAADAAVVCPAPGTGDVLATINSGYAYCGRGDIPGGITYARGRIDVITNGIGVEAYMFASTPFPAGCPGTGPCQAPTHLSVSVQGVDSTFLTPVVDSAGNRTCFTLDQTKNGNPVNANYTGNQCTSLTYARVRAHSVVTPAGSAY